MSAFLEQAMQQGLAHHRAGRLSEAEDVYRRVLQQDPNYPDALHLLGVIAHQVNRDDVAEELIRRAIEIAPLVADFHNSLGQALQSAGRADAAVDCYLRAIALEPSFADAYANLGIARRLKGDFAEAASALQQAAALQPNNPQILMHLGGGYLAAKHFDRAVDAFTAVTRIEPANAGAFTNMALALQQQGRLEAAAAAARQAVHLKPEQAHHHLNLGIVLQQQERHEEAIASFLASLRLRNDPNALSNLAVSLNALDRTDEAIAALQHALNLRPDSPQDWLNLGAAMQEANRWDDAMAAFSQAIALKPDFAEAHNNLGLALLAKEQLDEAIATLQRAISLNPSIAQSYANLGLALRRQGRHADAIATYRQALALRPQMPVAHANMLQSMNYEPELDAKTVYEEHVAWARAHVSNVNVTSPARDHDRDPDRRLRIGYVSPDLRRHVIAQFFEPQLIAHDRARFEVVCYSDVTAPDEVTERLRGLADQWHDVTQLSDEQLAERIRTDQIDILVDLAGHNGSSLAVFARKPAPVQVAYLGYPNTTALPAMDHRITDAWADPVGMTDPFYTEKLWRLPRCAWCFSRPADAPPVAPPPADQTGHITFGSFNKFTKLSSPLLVAWAKLLELVPDARLVIKSTLLRNDSARRALNEKLAAHHLPADRCEVIGEVSYGEHLATYGRVDLALDPFPYHGTTTTCEALYMGVPVVTLAGDRHVSRVGVSLLHAVGLDDLVATSWDDYIAKAAELARDRERLRTLRTTLRARMEQSPLMDGPGLTREIESALRQMWRTWCAT